MDMLQSSIFEIGIETARMCNEYIIVAESTRVDKMQRVYHVAAPHGDIIEVHVPANACEAGATAVVRESVRAFARMQIDGPGDEHEDDEDNSKEPC
jgi:hypothetical protein